MTLDEFIDGYMKRSNLKPEYRLVDGFQIPTCQPTRALPCYCDEELCEGWAMVPENLVLWHKFQNGLISKEEMENAK
jgi:hypothetical protein